MKILCVFVSLLVLPLVSSAQTKGPVQPKAPGIESKDYRWHQETPEEVQILKLKGSAEGGRSAYAYCRGCHRSDGAGRPDGSYPQLAGQHATVLIKQIVDVRTGVRDNPRMFPFAGQHVLDTQDVADIAAYLEQLPVPEENGKGPGKDVERGRALYGKDCQICHGANGEGDRKKVTPMVAGQHYLYLLRQLRQVQTQKRRNADPDMVEAVRSYTDEDMQIVSDYMSRLDASGRPAQKTPSK